MTARKHPSADRRAVLAGFAALGAAPATASRVGPRTRILSVDEALARLWPKTTSVQFLATTVRERRAATTIVPALLRTAASDDARLTDLLADARSADLDLEIWQVGPQRHFVLFEPETRRRGAGAYLFAALPPALPMGDRQAGPVMLQAPHAYFDRDTGAIAGRIYFESTDVDRPRAFFTNTIHRYQDGPGPPTPHPDSRADVCHNPDHLFSAATRAAAGTGGYRFVQIHGFAPGREGPADDTRAVVSAGRAAGSTPVSATTADRLLSVLGAGTRRFPEETNFLGATNNVQGRLLAAFPGNDFVHIELAPAIRRQLLGETDLRQRFARSLTQPVAR